MKNIFTRSLITAVLPACFFMTLHAQTIGLLKDINASKDGNPSVTNYFMRGNQFAVIGKTAYFTANDGVHGIELWRCDTTNGATAKMVKDITPGAGSTNARDFIVVGNKLYFTGPGQGDELWVSNGTEAGTLPLCPIRSFSFLAVGNILYFTAGDYDPNEIWKTDGTVAGTVLVATLNTSQLNFSAGIGQLTYLNGNIFFTTYSNNVYGDELWKTNGTQAGTVLVKDINPGTGNSYPQNFTALNGKLYFSAADATGNHLWVTDGTTAGTKKVKNTVNCSIQNSVDYFYVVYIAYYKLPPMVAVNNILYFPGFTDDKGWELCSYNTADSLRSIAVAKDISAGPGSSSPINLTAVNGTLFFTAYDTTGHQRLYKNKGTLMGAQLVKDIDPSGGANTYFSNLVNANGTLYFAGYTKQKGYELWKSDGTGAGTIIVRDIFAGKSNSSNPDNVTYVGGNTVFFSAFDGVNGRELWKTDGTTAGTVMLKDINTITTTSSSPSLYRNSAVFNGKAYFAASDPVYGTELYVSSGTAGGTRLVKNIADGNQSSSPSNLTAFKNVLYFLATQNDTLRLFKSDGTAAGTTYFHTIPGNFTEGLATTDSLLYQFEFNGFDNLLTIWRTDGTTNGTAIVKTITNATSGYDNGLSSTHANIGNTLYFLAGEKIHGTELWKTDGTAAGTVMIKDIYPGAMGSNPEVLYAYNKKLYFSAQDALGYGFFVSNGNTGGTKLIKRLHLYFNTRDSIINTLNGKMILAASTDSTGDELYASDGTPEGTVLIKDIYPGTVGSNPDNLTIADTIAYFTAVNPKTNLQAVWRTNGTASGTWVVSKDLNSTLYLYPMPQDLIFLNHKLYFVDIDSTSAMRLWVTNGTLAGTHEVSIPDVTNFDMGITSAGNKLIVSATSYAYGYELYGGVPPGLLKNSSLALQGRLNDNNGQLNWYTTGSEGSDYIVQRSTNGSQFNSIGKVNGSTDGFNQSNFDYTDANITSLGVPVVYYRLQQLTAEGDTANSKAVAINIHAAFNAAIYPNPVVNSATLQVSGAGKGAVISITNMAGKTVWHGTIEGNKTLQLPVSGLAAGAYIVTVSNGEETKMIKMVKEK